MWEAAKFQFLVAISIFVAIVPEGLPIILVTTLAIGMRNMARHKAIIRRMKAVETLGSTTVICTDKTGTLTKNQMTVRRLMLPEKTFGITGEGFLPEGPLLSMIRNCRMMRCLNFKETSDLDWQHHVFHYVITLKSLRLMVNGQQLVTLQTALVQYWATK